VALSGDAEDTLEPVIGWAVQPGDAYAVLLDRLIQRADTPPGAPLDAVDFEQFRGLNDWSSDLIRLLERANGLSLGGGACRFRALEQYESFHIALSPGTLSAAGREMSYGRAVLFGDLADGRMIACYGAQKPRDPRTTGQWRLPWGYDWWVLVGTPQSMQSDSGDREVLVVACSLPHFFERLLHAPDPLFFDATDFTPPATL